MKVSSLITQHDSLNSSLWTGDRIRPLIKSKLLEIANEFYENLEIVKKALVDITFTGSLANFNYTSASDIDLHLIVDFSKIDNNKFLVGEYFKAMTRDWNRTHAITIKKYEIEIYVQDKDEPHFSTGVYSLLSDTWLSKPQQKNVQPDVGLINKKIEHYADMVDEAEDLYDGKDFEAANDLSRKIMKKIKKFRQSGLEEEGEFSNENIVFKYLRNNKVIKSLIDVRNQSYDKMMSINGDPEKMFKVYLDKRKKTKTYNRLTELERYQRKVRRGHSGMKRRLIGYGGNKNTSPYTKRASFKRAKSAPPGAGGS